MASCELEVRIAKLLVSVRNPISTLSGVEQPVHTTILMRLSSLVLGIVGLAASFMPQEILAHYGSRSSGLGVLLMQVVGALYLGFAVLNWMARDVLIGGIYARPVALGNFLHFGVVGLTVWKTIARWDVQRRRDHRGGDRLFSLCGLVWFGRLYSSKKAMKRQRSGSTSVMEIYQQL